MKTILTAILLLGGIVSAQAQIKQVEFQAAGVTCSMCSKAINKALTTLDFVDEVKPDLQKNIFTVTFKDSGAVNLDAIRKKVEDAGFSVAKLWISLDVAVTAVKSEAHIQNGGLNLHFINVKEQQLNGMVKLRVVDKGFTTAKEYKKLGQYTSMNCYKTGYMEGCCAGPGKVKGERIFHVTI